MPRYFKCIGLNQNACGNWNEHFTIGCVYEFIQNYDTSAIELKSDNGRTYNVDRDQFEEITVHVIVPFSEDGTIVADIPHNKATRKDRRRKFLTGRLSKPDLEVEEMNKLLDELNSLK